VESRESLTVLTGRVKFKEGTLQNIDIFTALRTSDVMFGMWLS
jgi:hypothetical protein